MNGVVKYDCGKHGRLSVSQISELTGLGLTTIRNRISRGMTGEEIAQARITKRKRRTGESYRDDAVRTAGVGNIAVAVSIARAFPNRAPTVHELRERFGMHKSTAYRWRAAFIDAAGET